MTLESFTTVHGILRRASTSRGLTRPKPCATCATPTRSLHHKTNRPHCAVCQLPPWKFRNPALARLAAR